MAHTCHTYEVARYVCKRRKVKIRDGIFTDAGTDDVRPDGLGAAPFLTATEQSARDNVLFELFAYAGPLFCTLV